MMKIDIITKFILIVLEILHCCFMLIIKLMFDISLDSFILVSDSSACKHCSYNPTIIPTKFVTNYSSKSCQHNRVRST